MPLAFADVVIPTNSAEKTNIVLKAGQRVMVLKSPKGIYMQLESGKIIAIKTSFKGLGGQKGDSKDSPLGKKSMYTFQRFFCGFSLYLCINLSFYPVVGVRPSAANIPGSLKNNSAITITSKSGPRPGYQRILNRPGMMGSNKLRPMMSQKIAEMRHRLGFNNMRARSPMQGRMLRPSLPGSVSITKIPREIKRPNNDSKVKMEVDSEEDTHVLDSDEEDTSKKDKSNESKASSSSSQDTEGLDDKTKKPETEDKENDTKTDDSEKEEQHRVRENDEKPKSVESHEPLVLTTDEKFPTEEALESRSSEERSVDYSKSFEAAQSDKADITRPGDRIERKINLLKNYRHHRTATRPPESSLSQLEKTASFLNKEGMPDLRKNLDDITQSYSPTNEEKTSKSKKKKSPNKVEGSESQIIEPPRQPAMSHSVSSLLGPSGHQKMRPTETTVPIAPIENLGLSRMRESAISPMGLPTKPQSQPAVLLNMSHSGLMTAGSPSPVLDMSKSALPAVPLPSSTIPPTPMATSQPYPAISPPEAHYGQYPPGKFKVCGPCF